MKFSEFIRSHGFEPRDLSDDQLDGMAEWHSQLATTEGDDQADGDDDLRKVDAVARHKRIQAIESLCAGFPSVRNKAILNNWSDAASLRKFDRSSKPSRACGLASFVSPSAKEFSEMSVIEQVAEIRTQRKQAAEVRCDELARMDAAGKKVSAVEVIDSLAAAGLDDTWFPARVQHYRTRAALIAKAATHADLSAGTRNVR